MDRNDTDIRMDTTPADMTTSDTMPADMTFADSTPTDMTIADTTPADTMLSPAGEVSERALNIASRYLSFKPRTKGETAKHLKDKGIGPKEISACISLLEEYRLLDDLEYSRMYMETMLQRGRGMARICRELQNKGVDRFIIEDAQLLIEEDAPDEYEMALEQASAALEDEDVLNMDYREKQKIRSRIAGRLARRGYGTDTVLRAVRTAFAQREEEQRSGE